MDDQNQSNNLLSGRNKFPLIVPIALIVVIVLLVFGILAIPYFGESSKEVKVNLSVSEETSPVGIDSMVVAKESLYEFAKRTLKDEYIPRAWPDLSEDKTSTSSVIGTVEGIVASNGNRIFPVYVQGSDGKYWRKRISVYAYNLPDKSLGTSLLKFNSIFNAHTPENDALLWETYFESSIAATYERIIDQSDGSFDSEIIWVITDRDDGQFKALMTLCNTSKASPSFASRTCVE